jgi:hypothetical protein
LPVALPDEELEDDELLDDELEDELLELDDELLDEELLLVEELLELEDELELLEDDEFEPDDVPPPHAASISNATLRGTNFLYIGSPRFVGTILLSQMALHLYSWLYGMKQISGVVTLHFSLCGVMDLRPDSILILPLPPFKNQYSILSKFVKRCVFGHF